MVAREAGGKFKYRAKLFDDFAEVRLHLLRLLFDLELVYQLFHAHFAVGFHGCPDLFLQLPAMGRARQRVEWAERLRLVPRPPCAHLSA